MSKKSISRTKRDLTDRLLSLGPTDFFKQLVQADVFADIPEETRNRFITLVDQVGDKLYKNGQLLATMQLPTLCIQVFEPEEPNGWALEHVHSPTPERGVTDGETLLPALTAMAKAAGDARLALFSFGSPIMAPTDPYFMVFIVADAHGQLASGVIVEESTHWLRPDTPHFVTLLQHTLPYPLMPEGFYADVADDLAHVLAEEASDTAASSADTAQRIRDALPQRLGSRLAPLLDEEASLRMGFAIKTRRAFEAYGMDVAAQQEETRSVMEKAHQKQMKQLKRAQDKSAMLLKGCQERADRLARELSSLRKSKGVGQAAAPPTPLGEALDALFG